MIPYNAKLWGVEAHTITSRWCQRFVPRPQLEDIVAGAVGVNEKAMGYNARFLYPRFGGIQTVAIRMAEVVGHEKIHLNSRVQSIDLDANEARLTDGRTIAFKRLVNTTALLPSWMVSTIAQIRFKGARTSGRQRSGLFERGHRWVIGPTGSLDLCA